MAPHTMAAQAHIHCFLLHTHTLRLGPETLRRGFIRRPALCAASFNYLANAGQPTPCEMSSYDTTAMQACACPCAGTLVNTGAYACYGSHGTASTGGRVGF